jgi:hypothetical protein
VYEVPIKNINLFDVFESFYFPRTSVVDPNPVDPSLNGLLDPDPLVWYNGSGSKLFIKDSTEFEKKFSILKYLSMDTKMSR